MRIDCHTHTKVLSGCSSLKPSQLCSLALKRGLQGLVITEHRQQWQPEDLAALQRKFPELSLYGGVELSTREGYDVICIAGDIMLDLPAFPDAAMLAELRERHGEDIFTFVAHPFRYRNFMTPDLQAVLEVVEGIEMNSMNILKTGPVHENGHYLPENHELYDRARRDYDLAPVFNSDTHSPHSVGCIANELPGEASPQNAAELGRLLREGASQEWQNPEVIEHFLDKLYIF